MGCSYEYKCASCAYAAMTSAGASGGFNIKTDTFVCIGCSIIQDLATEKAPRQAIIPMIETTEDRDYKLVCKQCRSADHLVKWDNTLRPCPKCGTGMEKNERVFVMWD